ncbi:hypothetical protein [Nocardia sp. 348MFTsu5.1]|uniref:hypothetical protein n=1 Tax=Nocardia sp. 348MFTsu5.1 TaxID=1172185 RepID=UPI0012DF9AB9|nr:hypothetical protein [Nocardia sp. 348MFTsu5.1]
MTRTEVHEKGGPADTTMARIENPVPETASPRPTTLRRLDLGLSWPEGHAAKILHGSTQVVDAPGTQDLTDALSFTTMEIPVSIIQDIVQAASKVVVALPNADSEDLKACVQRLTAIYATEVLERVGGPGTARIPLIDLTFRDLLDTPLAAPGDPMRTEQLYRRWLAGMLPDDEKDLSDAFTTRWKARRRSIRLREDTS